MSVFTSSWVPIYEGNAEADHSDTTERTFMDLYKQIEYADEFTNSATIDLGTDDMSFVKNSYSVGYLEVNESSGGLFLTTNLTRINPPESSFEGVGLEIIGINQSSDKPLDNFLFNLIQTDGAVPPSAKMDIDFILQMVTTYYRSITLYNFREFSSDNDELIIIVKYDDPTVRWEKVIDISNRATLPNISSVNGDAVLNVDLLDRFENLTLIEGTNQEINGTVINNGREAPLGDVIQHWAGFGDESSYFIHYMQYRGVTDGEIYADVESSSTSNTSTELNGTEHTEPFYHEKIGGGTLTMTSDYNFMVDQSYVYDNGAVFLSQNDGEVFKSKHPIVTSDNNGTLNLVLTSVVLKGNYKASGNGVKTLYTTLVDDERLEYGNTNNITIVKETTSEYYDFWISYFEEIKSYANNGFTNINATLTNNTNQTNMTLIINDTTSTQNIYVTVNTKVIQVS